MAFVIHLGKSCELWNYRLENQIHNYTLSRLYHCQFSCLVHIRTDLDLLNCFMPSKYLSWRGCNTPLKKFQLARMMVFWQTLISASASIENIIFCKKCELCRVVYYLLLITYVIIKNSGGSEGGEGRVSPPGAQNLSISCSFWENLAKSYVGAP